MERISFYILLGGGLAVLALSCYAALFNLLKVMARPGRVRRFWGSGMGFADSGPPGWMGGLLKLGNSSGEREEECRQLLAGAGIRLHPEWYRLARGGAICFFALALILLWLFRNSAMRLFSISPYAFMAVAAGGLICIWFDRPFLEQLKRRRANLIVEEIYNVSRQLLYFTGSPIPLHGKLMRCLAYTKLIRQDWHLLLNEWYQDAEGAVQRFRGRLGTEEGYGFAETLNYLRLYDNDAYYHLLRQRVDDCKERLELLRDSRKESTSYALFVIASIPVMYTFQIFIYPWVQEGQRLFQGLN